MKMLVGNDVGVEWFLLARAMPFFVKCHRETRSFLFPIVKQLCMCYVHEGIANRTAMKEVKFRCKSLVVTFDESNGITSVLT